MAILLFKAHTSLIHTTCTILELEHRVATFITFDDVKITMHNFLHRENRRVCEECEWLKPLSSGAFVPCKSRGMLLPCTWLSD